MSKVSTQSVETPEERHEKLQERWKKNYRFLRYTVAKRLDCDRDDVLVDEVLSDIAFKLVDNEKVNHDAKQWVFEISPVIDQALGALNQRRRTLKQRCTDHLKRAEYVHGHEPEPYQIAYQNERAEIVRKTLRKLPAKNRQVVRSTLMHGNSTRSEANRLGTGKTSVRRIINRSLEQIAPYFPNSWGPARTRIKMGGTTPPEVVQRVRQRAREGVTIENIARVFGLSIVCVMCIYRAQGYYKGKFEPISTRGENESFYFSDEDIENIRKAWTSGTSRQILAEKYGCCDNTIDRVTSGVGMYANC